MDSTLVETTTDHHDGIYFTAEDHSSRMLSKMASLRSKNQLCDVVLKVGSREIHAHRVVLSACSSYFCAMFTNTMMESKQDSITLTDLDENAVEELVNFAYTTKINVHEGNVQPVLKAASILQLSEIVGACCSFLNTQLYPSNCLGIASFAEAHGCTALAESAKQFVHDHFDEVVRCEEFVHLRPETLNLLLSSNDLNVISEESVFDAMYRWLKHDLPDREKHCFSALSCIRLPLLMPKFLVDHVFTEEVFRQHQQCMELMMGAMIYHSVDEKRPHLREILNDSPRLATLGTLFAIGGVDSCRNSCSIEFFDARKSEWNMIPNSQSACKRLQFGVVVLNSKIYVVGGRNGLRTLNTVDCYDAAINHWVSATAMCCYRHGVGVTMMSGPLYAVGGHDGWSYLASVERFDPEMKQWSLVSPMSSARSTAGVAVLDSKLYVVGGRDSNSCLSSGECYDPHTDRWAALPPMNVCRGGIGVVVLLGKLYAIGGHAVSDPLKSVEVYDPKTKEWTFVASMQCARDAVATVAFGGKIYAIGGFDGSLYLESVEFYDPEEDVWTLTAGLRSGRAGAGVVVVPDFFMDNDLLHGVH